MWDLIILIKFQERWLLLILIEITRTITIETHTHTQTYPTRALHMEEESQMKTHSTLSAWSLSMTVWVPH